LKDLNKELKKEIREQLKAITISLEKKSKCKNDDENNEAGTEKKKYQLLLTIENHVELHVSGSK
jgi:hypothetical protein